MIMNKILIFCIIFNAPFSLYTFFKINSNRTKKNCFKDLSVFCISKKTLLNLLPAQKKLLNF